MRPLLALALPPLLAACAAGGGRGCGAVLANASSQAIEQFYLTRVGAEGWGTDLIAQGNLAPGGTLPVRFPTEGNYGLRAVWTNGRAVEMQGVEACRTSRITVRDGAVQAE
jgi:hypothetical protein